ncbi:MAG TPA: hypothetical protein VF032_19145 [Thermoleophilaceae bacterium]
MTYFRAVRLYSAFESLIFTALLVTWIGGMSAHAQLVLGWIHGIGWTCLCAAVAIGCRRGMFPWWLLAATVSPIGPIGSSIGIEILNRERMSSPASG